MIGGPAANEICARIELIVIKWRFRCDSCQKVFTEPDTACGWRRRTTTRLREAIGEQAFDQPLSDVGHAFGVGSRFVQSCFQSVLHVALMQQGRPLEEGAPLLAPRLLGIDEFARRKGHVYDTILCELQERQVLARE